MTTGLGVDGAQMNLLKPFITTNPINQQINLECFSNTTLSRAANGVTVRNELQFKLLKAELSK